MSSQAPSAQTHAAMSALLALESSVRARLSEVLGSKDYSTKPTAVFAEACLQPLISSRCPPPKPLVWSRPRGQPAPPSCSCYQEHCILPRTTRMGWSSTQHAYNNIIGGPRLVLNLLYCTHLNLSVPPFLWAAFRKWWRSWLHRLLIILRPLATYPIQSRSLLAGEAMPHTPAGEAT